jgi:DNA-binding HxlR family transcriptional regulator
MRSYAQYCALAKALDVVGERWNLLIVRELLLRDGCRYTDLRNGLPGVATNLLAERLNELVRAGVVSRDEAPPPIATNVFRLTARGRALEAVILELANWGAPLLATAPKTDRFRTQWLGLCARNCLRDHAPHRPPITIEVRTGTDEPLLIETVSGEIRTHAGASADPDAVLAGPRRLVVEVLTGHASLAEARRAGLRYAGDPHVLHRVQPRSRERARRSGTTRHALTRRVPSHDT